MKRLPTLTAAVALFAAPALAAEDPIAVRQALMSGNGAAAGVGGAIMKGEVEYTPVVGKAVIVTINGAAQAFGDYFPEGSVDPENSRAAPKIWEDMAGFEEELAKFRDATSKAVEVAGKDGPPDGEAFGTAMGPVFDSCKSCHETYRLEE